MKSRFKIQWIPHTKQATDLDYNLNEVSEDTLQIGLDAHPNRPPYEKNLT